MGGVIRLFFGRGLFVFFLIVCVEARGQDLCVQILNAYGPFYAKNRAERTARLKRDFEAEPPCDLLLLQEVWFESHLDHLNRAFDPKGIWFDRVRKDSYRTGLSAFVFDGRASEWGAFRFKYNYQGGFFDWLRRLSGIAKGLGSFKWKSEKAESPVLVANLHFHPSVEAIRIAQIYDVFFWLVQRFERHGNEPLILAGDFNSKPGTLEYKLIRALAKVRDSWPELNGDYAKDACTYCRENPLNMDGIHGVLDYVFYRSGASTELTAKRSRLNLFGTRYDPISDHYGVRTEFDLTPTPVASKSVDLDRVATLVRESVHKVDHKRYRSLRRRLSQLLTAIGSKNKKSPYYRYFQN